MGLSSCKKDFLEINPSNALPPDIARRLNLHEGDVLQASIEGDRLILSLMESSDVLQKGGDEGDLTVNSEASKDDAISFSSMIGKGRGLFKNAEEIDRFIRNGREDNR